MDITDLSKFELRQLISQIQKQIQQIDELPIYSLRHYYCNDCVTRAQLVDEIHKIETEIAYREDDEKFKKYRPMKDRDPLKYKPNIKNRPSKCKSK